MREHMDMTPVCEKCGAVAPVDKEMSTENWIVHRVKEPCRCGGKYISKWLLEQKNADKEKR